MNVNQWNTSRSISSSSSQDVFLLLYVVLKWALVVVTSEKVLELAPNRVVFSLSKVGLGLVSEHPVLNWKMHESLSFYYLGMQSVYEIGKDRVEEELVVANSWGHVLLPEDFVIVEAELKVARAVPIEMSWVYIEILFTRRVFSRNIALQSDCLCKSLTY